MDHAADQAHDPKADQAPGAAQLPHQHLAATEPSSAQLSNEAVQSAGCRPLLLPPQQDCPQTDGHLSSEAAEPSSAALQQVTDRPTNTGLQQSSQASGWNWADVDSSTAEGTISPCPRQDTDRQAGATQRRLTQADQRSADRDASIAQVLASLNGLPLQPGRPELSPAPIGPAEEVDVGLGQPPTGMKGLLDVAHCACVVCALDFALRRQKQPDKRKLHDELHACWISAEIRQNVQQYVCLAGCVACRARGP